jgi:hypothetical protein
MRRHRLPRESEPIRLPRPPAPVIAPGSFVVCPVAPAAGLGAVQQALYRWAFEQARAVVQPSLPERDLLGVWN